MNVEPPLLLVRYKTKLRILPFAVTNMSDKGFNIVVFLITKSQRSFDRLCNIQYQCKALIHPHLMTGQKNQILIMYNKKKVRTKICPLFPGTCSNQTVKPSEINAYKPASCKLAMVPPTNFLRRSS